MLSSTFLFKLLLSLIKINVSLHQGHYHKVKYCTLTFYRKYKLLNIRKSRRRRSCRIFNFISTYGWINIIHYFESRNIHLSSPDTSLTMLFRPSLSPSFSRTSLLNIERKICSLFSESSSIFGLGWDCFFTILPIYPTWRLQVYFTLR